MPPIRAEDAILLLAMGLVLLVLCRGIMLRPASVLLLMPVAGYALLAMLGEERYGLPAWVLVFLLVWVGYALIRALGGLLLGREVADHILANLLTLIFWTPLWVLSETFRKLFRL